MQSGIVKNFRLTVLWSSVFVTLVAKKYQFSFMVQSVPDTGYGNC